MPTATLAPTPYPLEGGCDCRAVRYRIQTAPLVVHCCHCRWCQRESGSAFALNAMIESDRVESLGMAPELVRTPSASGQGQQIARCPRCRVAVWSHYAGSGPLTRFVRVGTLDHPDALPPDVHIFTASRQPWVVLPEGTPAFAEYYEREAVWSAGALARRAALLPQIQAWQATQSRSDFSPPPAIELRAAAAGDALCLSVLAMQVFLDTYATGGIRPPLAREVLASYSEQAFTQALARPECRMVVAERSGHLVGFAQLTLGQQQALAPPGAQTELLRLYVQEPFTGTGLGTRLIDHAERLAAEAGAAVLWLTPWVHNHRALAFYRRRGYQDCGLTHFHFEGESHENRVLAKPVGVGKPPARLTHQGPP